MTGSGICPICAGRVGITDSGVLGSHGRYAEERLATARRATEFARPPILEGGLLRSALVPCEGAGSFPT